jgi:Flp pilus assembly protein protease CpaA
VGKVFGFLFGNWFARAYLLIVVVVAVLVFAALEIGGEDTNLAGVWLVLVTLPGSLLASPVAGLASGGLSTVIFFGMLAVSALINAALISLVVHAVRRRRPRRT